MKNYCPLPFRAVFLSSEGISPCCQLPRQDVLLNDWENNQWLKELQTKFLNGEQPEICSSCFNNEKEFGTSLRTQALNDYNNKIFNKTNIDFIDYRSSNICNFKCRSCTTEFSHRINKEVQDYPELSKFYGPDTNSKTINVGYDNERWIINNITEIKRLMFTGGEPTVIPQVKQMLEQVLLKSPNTNILITSNCSFTDSFWFDLTRRLSTIHWTASIDATGRDSELIRHGTDWKIVEHNLRWLAKNSNSLDINTVISNLNVMRLKPLLKLVKELQQISIAPNGKHGDQGCRHQFFVCQAPYYLAANNWPDNKKHSVIKYLNECLEMNLDAEQEDTIQHLITLILKSKFNNRVWNQSIEFNSLLDQIRNENYLDLQAPINEKNS